MMNGRDGMCCGEDESEVRSGKRQGIVFSHFTFFAFFFLFDLCGVAKRRQRHLGHRLLLAAGGRARGWASGGEIAGEGLAESGVGPHPEHDDLIAQWAHGHVIIT